MMCVHLYWFFLNFIRADKNLYFFIFHHHKWIVNTKHQIQAFNIGNKSLLQCYFKAYVYSRYPRRYLTIITSTTSITVDLVLILSFKTNIDQMKMFLYIYDVLSSSYKRLLITLLCIRITQLLNTVSIKYFK